MLKVLLRVKAKKKPHVLQSILDKSRMRKKRRNKSWQRYWKYYKLKILRLKENPQKISRGFAAGVFAGCLPLMGLQFLVSLLFAILVRGNKITALMGTWISNPFTYVPLFLFNFKVGKLIINLLIPNYEMELSLDSGQKLTDLGQDITIAILLGSIVVGFCSSFIAYHLILFLLKKWNKH
jgi:uncharacterized protein (DUF2062 family)